MLLACRLAGLSALETYYAGVRVSAQFGAAYMAARATFDRRRGAVRAQTGGPFRGVGRPWAGLRPVWQGDEAPGRDARVDRLLGAAIAHPAA
jgi:hypothetical protein